MSANVWECYRQVFDDSGDDESWHSGMFARHVTRDGFRLVIARERGAVMGFSWGYYGARGKYWSDLAFRALPAHVTAEWIGGHFEFVERGVLFSHRSAGVGHALHDALLEGVRSRALLSTKDDESDPAVRPYRRHGWRRLGILSPGFQVMGRP